METVAFWNRGGDDAFEGGCTWSGTKNITFVVAGEGGGRFLSAAIAAAAPAAAGEGSA